MAKATTSKASKAKTTAKPADTQKKKMDELKQKAEELENVSSQPITGPGKDRITALGSVCWLMSQMATHKHLFFSDIEWLVTPPVALGQFRLWHREGIPVAYACWAYLDEENEERMKQGGTKLAPAAWKSGDNLWLMDVLVPFGGQEEVIQELREQVFKGQRVKTLQPAPDGSGMAVVEW